MTLEESVKEMKMGHWEQKMAMALQCTCDYGWSMDFGTSQGSVAVEYGRVLEYPKKRNKSQTTRKPDLFR